MIEVELEDGSLVELDSPQDAAELELAGVIVGGFDEADEVLA